MTWIIWLWGNVCWQGTGAPWEQAMKNAPYAVASMEPHCIINSSTARCGNRSFKSCGQLAGEIGPPKWRIGTITRLQRTSTSKLQVPESLIEALQPGQKRELRRKVAEHQYPTMIGMTQLRGTLPMMPKDPAWVEGNARSAWYGALRARKVSPNVTEKNPREQVHYQPKKRTTRVVKADQHCKGATAPLRQVYNKVKVYAVEDVTRKRKRQLLDILGSPIM